MRLTDRAPAYKHPKGWGMECLLGVHSPPSADVQRPCMCCLAESQYCLGSLPRHGCYLHYGHF